MPDRIDFNALTKAQQEALNQIAIGQDGGHHRKTLESLVKRGLIEPYPAVISGVRVTRYEMPIAVHIEWCEWCSRQIAEEPHA